MLNYTKIEERIQHTVNYLLCMRRGRTMKNDQNQIVEFIPIFFHVTQMSRCQQNHLLRYSK
jgi:hypothetical protein